MTDRVVVVGSGTVVPEGDRGGSSYFVHLGKVGVLLDCGPGAVQGLARLSLPWSELRHLVLSHFHADHLGALPGLLFGLKHGVLPPRTRRPLDVWGPPGTRATFERLEAALGEFVLDPGFPVEVHELEPDDEVRLDDHLRLRTHKTPHTDESQAVRLDGETGSVGYSGDSGPSATLGPFMEDTDVLICECSLPDPEVGDNHLSPRRVAPIAVAARPGVLLLTHIYPHFRAGHDVVGLVRQAGYTEGEVELAFDGWERQLS